VAVKKAYKALTKIVHPDKNPGCERATNAFQRLQAFRDLLLQELNPRPPSSSGSAPAPSGSGAAATRAGGKWQRAWDAASSAWGSGSNRDQAREAWRKEYGAHKHSRKDAHWAEADGAAARRAAQRAAAAEAAREAWRKASNARTADEYCQKEVHRAAAERAAAERAAQRAAQRAAAAEAAEEESELEEEAEEQKQPWGPSHPGWYEARREWQQEWRRAGCTPPSAASACEAAELRGRTGGQKKRKKAGSFMGNLFGF